MLLLDHFRRPKRHSDPVNLANQAPILVSRNYKIQRPTWLLYL